MSESNNPDRWASCSCGQLRIMVRVDPMRVSVCHCLECQRRTGSTFGAQARFPEGETAIHGKSSVYARTGDSGCNIVFHFCPGCGSTVFYKLEASPDIVGVPVGAFADPNFPEPQMSFYESTRHSWVKMQASVERFDD